MINIDYYEVNEKENSEIFNKVLAYFKRQSSGVPFYVIGSKYEVGFPNPETMEKEYNETDAKIKKLIEEEYKDNKKTNIVKDIINEKVKVTTTEKSTFNATNSFNTRIDSREGTRQGLDWTDAYASGSDRTAGAR